MLTRCNRLYKPVFTTKARYIDIWGGRGRGGSYFLTDYALFLITQPKYFRGYFMREIFNDIKESLYRDFKDRVEENDTVNESDFWFNDSIYSITYKPTGNTIISKGFRKSSGKATAKLKSIAGATHVFIEEAEEIHLEDMMKLDDSLRTNKCENVQILRCWNSPNKDHWLISEYFDIVPHPRHEGFYTAHPNGRDDHLSIFGTYHDNRKNINDSTVKLWESYKDKNIDHYLTDICGLISGGVKGQVFKNWNTYKSLPEDAEFYRIFGIDWGGNDPNTFMELNIDKKQKRIFIRQHLYEPEVLNADLIRLVKEVNVNNDEVVCDSARKDKVLELQNAKVNAFSVRNPDKSIIDGIYVLKEYELFIHEDSRETLDEFANYRWAMNPETKEPLNKPEDKNNHSIDPLRYAAVYYHRNFSWSYDTNQNQ